MWSSLMGLSYTDINGSIYINIMGSRLRSPFHNGVKLHFHKGLKLHFPNGVKSHLHKGLKLHIPNGVKLHLHNGVVPCLAVFPDGNEASHATTKSEEHLDSCIHPHLGEDETQHLVFHSELVCMYPIISY